MIDRDQAILGHELFQGDRDSNVTRFSNKMLVTRKPHDCVICRLAIPAKTRVRAQTERDNDDQIVMTFYVCEPCCDAIAALALTGNDDALSVRYTIGSAV